MAGDVRFAVLVRSGMETAETKPLCEACFQRAEYSEGSVRVDIHPNDKHVLQFYLCEPCYEKLKKLLEQL